MPNWWKDWQQKQDGKYEPRGPLKGFMLGLDQDGKVFWKPPIVLQFSYNPSDMADTKSTNWITTNIPGLDRPIYAWSSGGERLIDFTLFLNAYEYGNEASTTLIDVPGLGGIKSELAKLDSFMYAMPTQYDKLTNFFKGTAAGLGAVGPLSWLNLANKGNAIVRRFASSGNPQFTPPPKCIFGFGAEIIECIVKKVDKKITMWNPSLDPIRAEVSVQLAVDENSPRALQQRVLRETLCTLGLTNFNPLASLPMFNSKGRNGRGF